MHSRAYDVPGRVHKKFTNKMKKTIDKQNDMQYNKYVNKKGSNEKWNCLSCLLL